MANYNERIAAAKEKIEQYENQMKQLVQKQKVQERKDRTKRLCKRAGLLENMLPDTIQLSDEQFKMFLDKAVSNDFGRRMLASIVVQNDATATAQTVGNGARKAV